MRWLTPPERLTTEIQRVLRQSHLRGADLYHLACALYYFEDPALGRFLTFDIAQREAAQKLGFATDWSFA